MYVFPPAPVTYTIEGTKETYDTVRGKDLHAGDVTVIRL